MGSVSFAKRQADPSDKERAVHPAVLAQFFSFPHPPFSVSPGSAPPERPPQRSLPTEGGKKRKGKTKAVILKEKNCIYF